MPIATRLPHPHLPIPLGDLSVWQHSTRDHPLLNKGKDEAIPAEADVVVIGSGMCGMYTSPHNRNLDEEAGRRLVLIVSRYTGAVVAHTLLKAEKRPKRIVLLEAREICSGASGRNAGHCRPGE